MDRIISSPSDNSSIVVSPSGNKSARFPYAGGFIIGQADDDSFNVKLHLGPNNRLEFVRGDDTTTEGFSSPNTVFIGIAGINSDSLQTTDFTIGGQPYSQNVKIRLALPSVLEFTSDSSIVPSASGSDYVNRVEVKAASLSIGKSADSSKNVRIKRSGDSSVEFITESGLATDSLPQPAYRASLLAKDFILGLDAAASNNIKLHKASASSLEIITASSSVSDGSFARSERLNVGVANLLVGASSTASDNVKIHRSGVKKIAFVTESDSTPDGQNSTNKCTIEALSGVFGTSASDANNVLVRRGSSAQLEIVPADTAGLVDGVPSTTKGGISVASVLIGQDANQNNNGKFRKGAAQEIEIVQGSDVSSEGATSTSKIKLNAKSFQVGNDSTLANNVLIRRASSGILEVASASDSTADGSFSSSKASLAAKDVIIGNSATASNNLKMHKGAHGEIDLVLGSDSVPDGTVSATNRAKLNLKNLTVGTDSTASNNIKLQKGASNQLEFVQDSDTTPENTLSANKVQINVKQALIGTSATPANNAILRRAGSGILQAVLASDATAEGARSDSLSQFSFALEKSSSSSNPTPSAANTGSLNYFTDTQRVVVSNGTSWLDLGQNLDRGLRENVGLSVVMSSNTMNVSLTTKDGSNPTAGNPVKTAFRSGTATNPVWTVVSSVSSTSLTVLEGATLGTYSGVSSRLFVYLMNSSTQPELAISQKYFDGSYPISSSAMASSSDSVELIYSSVARSNVAIACIGYVDISQAVAGEWASSPTVVYVGDASSKQTRTMLTNPNANLPGPGGVFVPVAAGDVGTTVSIGPQPTADVIYNAGMTPTTLTQYGLSVVTTGKPYQIFLQPGPSTLGAGYIKVNQSAATTGPMTAQINLLRTALNGSPVTVASWEYKLSETDSETRELKVSPSSVFYLDNPSAGQYTYVLQGVVLETNTQLWLTNVKLIGYELF